MSMFTLVISCLTTSNLPWFMNLTFQVPMQYCSLQNQTLLPSQVASTTGWWFCFGSISLFFMELFSPLISRSILGTCWPGKFIFQCLIFLPFHIVHGVLKIRILSGLPFPFSSGPCFVRNLHHDPSVLGGPTTAWLIVSLSLDKAVVNVIRLVNFLWLWFSFCLPSDGEG